MKTFLALLLTCLPLLAQLTLHDPAFLSRLTVVSSSGTAAFSPTNISGLQLWFDANTITGVAEGGAVSNWPSAYPTYATRYATNSTAAEWPFMTNSFNGTTNHALVWVGADEKLTVSNAWSVARNISSISIFSVSQLTASTLVKGLFHISDGINDNLTNRRAFFFFESDEKFMVSGKTLDTGDITVEIASSTAVTGLRWMFGADINYEAGNEISYTNNVLCASNVINTAAFTSNTDSKTVIIGAQDASFEYIGLIAEILVYVPAISASDRTNLWTYLNAKYAIRP